MPAKSAKAKPSFADELYGLLENRLVLASLVLSLVSSVGGSLMAVTVREPIARVETRQDKLETLVLERRQVRDQEYKETRAELAGITTKLEVLTEIVKRIEANQATKK